VRLSHQIEPRVPFLRWLLIAVGLVSLINLSYSAWHQDWTYDEPFHLGWSVRLLQTGETERASTYNYGSTTPITLLNAVPFRIAQARNWGDPLAKFLARLPTIGWWLGLVVATLLFARHYAGDPAASIAAMLVALDPNLGAHGCLVTVDVAYACITLLCLWAFLKLYETPRYYRAAVAGLALGLAFCTKYTAFLLVPLCLVALASGVCKLTRGVRAMLRALGLTVLIGVSATLCVCAGYLFSDIGVPVGTIYSSSIVMQKVLAVVPDLRLPLPKAFLSGFDLVKSLERTTTWNVVLLGNYYSSGIWYYFFVVWLVKTPLSMLAAVTAGMGSGLARGVLFRAVWSIFLLVSLVGFLAFFSFYFRTQVGLRYVLMCVPLAYLLGAPELGRWAQSTARGAILVSAVVVLALIEMGGYFGNQLSYTNLVILPKKSAYRWIADSNIAWGQNDGRNWKIIEAKQVTDRFEPLHILPGVNVFRLNTIAGVWGNHEQHRWVRENLEPKSHLNHTYLWYEVDGTAFDRFLNEERRSTPPDAPGTCQASLSMRSLAPEGSFRLSEGMGEIAWVVGCLEVWELLDLEIIAEQGDLIVGKSPTSGQCDGEHLAGKSRAWFRLEPGLYPFCAKSIGPFEGTWRVHHGSARFYQF
jgi:4-amino-4-deoxy-L-arabinose transferase-like glycosyltransferase